MVDARSQLPDCKAQARDILTDAIMHVPGDPASFFVLCVQKLAR
ncbi:MAG: hypothetical protein WAO04_16680 [Candidatus Sulfotelmatobacter sp.]